MKLNPADRQTNLNGARERRFWLSEEKRQIVAESFVAGASVSKVAQRYGVNANLLFTWRRQEARRAAVSGVEPLKLLPVTVAEAETSSAPAPAGRPVGRIEIILVGGERIFVGADVDAAALARVVKALSRR